jgi:hypothetical protein
MLHERLKAMVIFKGAVGLLSGFLLRNAWHILGKQCRPSEMAVTTMRFEITRLCQLQGTCCANSGAVGCC